jgi:hypothetical protein
MRDGSDVAGAETRNHFLSATGSFAEGRTPRCSKLLVLLQNAVEGTKLLKTLNTFMAVATFFAACSLFAQTPQDVTLTAASAEQEYPVVSRDAHERVWARVTWETNHAGRIFARTNSYIELATRLHARATARGNFGKAKC